ncbi:PA14 domain-containing protein [Streptomyces rimosus]|uniref:PA14 domain-containing protein n=1 Tax=Streptomyces rimosus TaxID=1927 RepID=UPI0031DD7E9A
MRSRTRPARLLGSLGAALGLLGALLTGAPTATAGTPGPAPHAAATGPGTNHAADAPFTSARTAWWRQARFGMFIHFGAYSHLEGEYPRPDGTLRPRHSETYALTTISDDTVRVWVDGRLVIDGGTPHGPRTDRAAVALTAGHRHAIRVEHTERTGEAHLELLWSSPSQEQQIVPRGALYPS